MVAAALCAALLAALSLAATAAVYAAGRGRGATGAEPLAPAGVARAFVHEWLAAVALLAALPLRLRPAARRRAAQSVAVFVPELRCSSAAFWYLRRRLRAAGWEGVAGIDRARSGDARAAMVDLDACLAALPAGCELVFVGHGVGGRLAYRYAAARPALRVRHVITLGTPHRGSGALPYRVLGAPAALASAPASSETQVDVIAIYSDFDAWLQPMDDAYCPGGFNIALSGVGHCAMLLSRRVADLIAENLAAPPPARFSSP